MPDSTHTDTDAEARPHTPIAVVDAAAAGFAMGKLNDGAYVLALSDVAV
jgi:hypothetical protein